MHRSPLYPTHPPAEKNSKQQHPSQSDPTQHNNSKPRNYASMRLRGCASVFRTHWSRSTTSKSA